jgi:hypothetical protein
MISEQRKRELSEKIKGQGLQLPPQVTCTKEFLPSGKIVYLFHHPELGNFGRMFISPNGNESQFNFEVTGEEDDPLTEKKKTLLVPMSNTILKQMQDVLGKGKGTVKPSTLSPQAQTIKAEHITCNKCDTLVALIVYAEEATTEAELTDHATIFFKKAKELNVPTWVIGKEEMSDIILDDEYVPVFLALKMWPVRGEVRLMPSTEMDDILCPLVEYHCK